jgi:glycerol-3-phosphate dehydrogenase
VTAQVTQREGNALIPQANLTRDQILFIYSGVRPLPHQPQGAEGSVTRSHVIYDHSEHDPRTEGLLSIIGGKLTTYRNLSRQTVNKAYKKLGTRAPKSTTDRVPLPGGAVRDFGAFSTEFE